MSWDYREYKIARLGVIYSTLEFEHCYGCCFKSRDQFHGIGKIKVQYGSELYEKLLATTCLRFKRMKESGKKDLGGTKQVVLEGVVKGKLASLIVLILLKQKPPS